MTARFVTLLVILLASSSPWRGIAEGSQVEQTPRDDVFNGNHHDSCVCQQTCSTPDATDTCTDVISGLTASQSAQNDIYRETVELLRQRLDRQEVRLQEIQDSLTTQLSQIATADRRKLEEINGVLTAIKTKVDRLPEEKPLEVFHVTSPLGSYKLTFAQAKELCESKGGVLATEAQLHAAWSRGLSYCSCGWLHDGSAQYPIHMPRDGCGGKDTAPGLRVCSTSNTGTTNPGKMWNAYCY